MRGVYIGQTAHAMGRSGSGRVREGDGVIAPPVGAEMEYTAPPEFVSSDWMQTRYATLSNTEPVPIEPWPNSSVTMTTPMFRFPWPYGGSSGDAQIAQVQYRVKAGPGTTVTITPALAGRNYCWPTTTLTRGVEYEYRVRNPVDLVYSDWRPFTVGLDAVDVLVPQGQALRDAAAARTHPRCLPLDFALKLANFRTGGALRAYTTAAITQFGIYVGDPLPNEGTVGTEGYAETRLEFWRIMECWWLWQIEGTTNYRDEGLRRWRNLVLPYTGSAGFLVESGVTDYTSHDQAGRSMLYAVAVPFDLFYNELTTTDKQRAYAMAGFRMTEMINDTAQIGIFPLRKNYQLSHPLGHCAVAGLAGLIFAGHEGEFSLYSWATTVPTWARNADINLQDFSGDTDEEGCDSRLYGYSRFEYEMATIVGYMGHPVGLDLLDEPRHYKRQKCFASIYPPVAVSTYRWAYPFGDGGNAGYDDFPFRVNWIPNADAHWRWFMETRGMNAITSVVSLNSGEPGQWWLMRSMPPAASVAGVPYAETRTEAGFAWFHSDPGDTQRATVWMRSSEIGGYGHRHTDANAFAMFIGGYPMFIKSGTYGDYSPGDAYASPFWYDWYKRSISGNTVALDNRLGHQRHTSYANRLTLSDSTHRRVRGRIHQFKRYATHAWVVGDAKNAYQHTGYVHTKAFRAIVHLKPNVFVIFDAHDLASGSYTWNWLFHTINIPVNAAGTITITNTKTATLKSLYANRPITSYTLTDTSWTTGTTAGLSSGGPLTYHNSINYDVGATLRCCHLIVANGITGGATPSSATCTTDASGMVATVVLGGVTFTVSFNETTGLVTVVKA